jgi:hypothetical protein
MSVAAMQAARFYEQVVADGVVYSFSSEGSFLVYPVGGQEVVPFWSSRSRLETITKNLPKYRAFQFDEIPFQAFSREVLPRLEAEGLLVGINWSGPRLVGYNVPVADVRRNLDSWIAKRGAAPEP